MIFMYRTCKTPSTYFLGVQYRNFVEESERDVFLQRLGKKAVSAWKKLIKKVVTYFFDDSVERELFNCVYNWFTVGEMSLFQFSQWKHQFEDILAIITEGNLIYTKMLTELNWGVGNHAKEAVSLFNQLLDDIPGDYLRKSEDFYKMLSSFLEPPQFELIDGGSRLKVTGKGMFLSSVIEEVLRRKTESVKEVNIYAKHFIGIDCSLKNKSWHGINLAIVADKITVWEKSEIDVSGKSTTFVVSKKQNMISEF